MVRRDVAGSKMARAEAWLADAEKRFGTSADAFVADGERRDLALFYVFLAIQECIASIWRRTGWRTRVGNLLMMPAPHSTCWRSVG